MNNRNIVLIISTLFLIIAVSVIAFNSNITNISNTPSDEEDSIQYNKTQTYDEVRNGIRLILRFDENLNSFVGTVENTSSAIVDNVRVEVHLSNGRELGPLPNPPINLIPTQKINIDIPSTNEVFQTWNPHAESGPLDSYELDDETDEHN